MSNRERIFADISAERARQDQKWGEQFHDLLLWNAILAEECGEVAEAAMKARFGDDAERIAELREELVQVAAVAVHFIEKLDDDRWQRSQPSIPGDGDVSPNNQ